MTSELSFLIDLLLKHKLPQATKDLIAERIKEVESVLSSAPVRINAPTHNPSLVHSVQNNVALSGAPQAPSTMAILARNPDLVPPPPVSEPVAVIAHTPAAAAALESRNAMIAKAASGNPPMKTRKFT